MTLPTLGECEKLYERYRTPPNISEHMQLVAKLAVKLATARQTLGEKVNVPLVEAAAKLHDLVRLPEQWPYLPPSIKPPLPHAEINYLLLKEQWPEVASVIRSHSLMTILRPQPFAALEEKIVYYADKRVNHATIVSLAERLEFGRDRWRVTKANDHTAELLTKLNALEQELFISLSFSPHELQNHLTT